MELRGSPVSSQVEKPKTNKKETCASDILKRNFVSITGAISDIPDCLDEREEKQNKKTEFLLYSKLLLLTSHPAIKTIDHRPEFSRSLSLQP